MKNEFYRSDCIGNVTLRLQKVKNTKFDFRQPSTVSQNVKILWLRTPP